MPKDREFFRREDKFMTRSEAQSEAETASRRVMETYISAVGYAFDLIVHIQELNPNRPKLTGEDMKELTGKVNAEIILKRLGITRR